MTAVTFQIEKDLQELKRIDSEMNNLTMLSGCDPVTMHEIYTIVEELLVNIINYGFIGEDAATKPDIKLTAIFEGDYLTLEFRDNGRPFNPLSRLRSRTQADEYNQTFSIGGWGINMVKDFSEKIDYCHENGFNIFTVRKKIKNNKEK